jgi:integrase
MADLRKQALSADYTRRTSERLERLKTAFGPRSIADIAEGDLRGYIDGQGGEPRTRKNLRDIIVTLWRWARREGYLPRDIQTEAERVKAPEIRRKAKIEIFTPEEMNALLTSCEPSIQPVIAICGFAGVRSDSLGEISRLTWGAIKWTQGEHGLIEVTESKTGARRLVPIQPNLLAWIERHKLATGLIWQGGRIDHAFARAATAAGIEWKINALRHSFGSYRVASTKSVDQTSLEMGNSPQMVRKHYLEAVHEDVAKKWFGIMP